MKNNLSILILGVLLFCGGLARATDITFDSGNPVGTIQTGDNYNQVTLHDSAAVGMTGGSGYIVESYDSSTFQLQGGNVTGWISVFNASNLTMSGGSVGDLQLFDSGIATISGGTITGSLGMFGTNTAIVNIYGKNFTFTPVGSSNGVIAANGWLIGGNWADNSQFTIFYRGYVVPLPGSASSQIVLHTIPEPATMFLLGFGILLARKRLSK